MTLQTGMGIVPLSWVEIKAWLDVSGLNLSFAHTLMLKRLSFEYTAELSRATDKEAMAPYSPVEVDHVELGNRLLAALRSLGKK